MTLIQSAVQRPVKTIRFIRRGEVLSLGNVPPERTLLELLREDLGLSGSKEGCGEGDCGACTVVPGDAENGQVRFRAINSCIRLAHSIDGMALWTVEDLAVGGGQLHPAQQAMLECHGSQCGFCTPGFVMSLFGMYQNHVGKGEKITRALAQEELSGNLCRCTGYRPILDAAQTMGDLPHVALDELALLQKLEQLAVMPAGPEADLAYKSPLTLEALLKARAAHPDAQIVAGCTDVGLWVTKLHQQFAKVLDVTRVRELRRIEDYPHHIAIGAAVPLSDAFAALEQDRPQLHGFAARFAGLPVRNSGTLGGNVANGSPIGDSMPLLIALRANVVLMSMRNGKIAHREFPLEQLYTGYRKNVMTADEVLAWIKVPKPGSPVLQTAARPEPGLLHAVQMRAGASGAAAFSPRPLPEGEGARKNDGGAASSTVGSKGHAPSPLWLERGGLAPPPAWGEGAGKHEPGFTPSPLWGEGGGEGLPELLRVYKISKRYDDISAICLAVNLHIANGTVQAASIGAGGVAATPVRAVKTEAALVGQPWTEATVKKATAVLRVEFSPISDMRASAAYRTQVLGNLLQRYWLESQGLRHINLESFQLEGEA